MVAAPPGSDLCGKTAIESSRDTALRLKLGSCETMIKFHDSIFLLERFSFAMAGEHKIRFCACAGGIGGDSEFAWSDSRGLVEDIIEVVRRIESAGCRDVLDRHFLKGEHLFGLIQSGEHDLIADRTPQMLAEEAAECRVRDADMVCDFLNR